MYMSLDMTSYSVGNLLDVLDAVLGLAVVTQRRFFEQKAFPSLQRQLFMLIHLKAKNAV